MKYFKLYTEFLNENRKLRFFHGTTSSNIESIRKNGLLTSVETNKKIHGFNTQGQISLSSDYNLAFYYSSLFSSKKPITILVIQLDTSYKIDRGFSHQEYVVKFDISPENILGAYDEKCNLIPLKKLDNTLNYIDFSLLSGSDLKVAKQYHTNS
jgi:hypothetical protein